MGRLSYARDLRRRPEGRRRSWCRAAASMSASARCSRCRARRPPSSPRRKDGDVVAIAKLEGVHAGEWLGAGKAPAALQIAQPVRNYTLAIATKGPQGRCPPLHRPAQAHRGGPGAALGAGRGACTRPGCKGVNDEHLKVTLERLRRRYGVAVDSRQPGGRLQGIDPQGGHPARPPQEAVGRPRPVRRLRDRGEAAGARRRLQVRRPDHRAASCRSSGSRRSRTGCATRWSRARSASRWSTCR